MGETMDAKTFLATRVPLFEGVADEHLVALATASALETYKSGQTMVFQGSTIDSLSIMIAGKAEVFAKIPGKGLTKVAELGPCDVFGERSIFEFGTTGATIKSAADPTLVLTIPQDAFRRLLNEDANFVQRVKALIASRGG